MEPGRMAFSRRGFRRFEGFGLGEGRKSLVCAKTAKSEVAGASWNSFPMNTAAQP